MSRLLFTAQARFAEGDGNAGGVLARSRRVRLRLYDDALEFGGWRIAYEDIDEALLISIRQLFIASYVLRIESGERSLRFGVNSDAFWRGQLPFAVDRVRGRMRLGPIWKLLRVALLVAMVWYVWRRLS